MEKKKYFDTLKGEVLQKKNEKRGPLECTGTFLIQTYLINIQTNM